MSQPRTWKQRMLHILRHHVRPFVFILLILLAVRSSLADWNDVPTGSMNPTILEGDRIFVNKLAYDLKVPFTSWRLARWSEPERGDVVVFYAPHDGTRMVKRVAAVGGDRVEMINGMLVINGQHAEYGPIDQQVLEDYPPRRQTGQHFGTETVAGMSHPVMQTPSRPSIRSFEPIVVPEGQFLLLGDNRDNSMDSRYWGFVDRDQIVGKATGVVLSLDPDQSFTPRWGRWFSGLR